MRFLQLVVEEMGEMYKIRPEPLKHVREVEITDNDVGEKLKTLLLLCHPDKHNDSPQSEEMTRWLLSLRTKNK